MTDEGKHPLKEQKPGGSENRWLDSVPKTGKGSLGWLNWPAEVPVRQISTLARPDLPFLFA